MFCNGFSNYNSGSSSFMGFGPMFLMMFFSLLVFIGLVAISVKLFKNHSSVAGDPMKILNEKFARGVISEEDYLKKKSVLSQKN